MAKFLFAFIQLILSTNLLFGSNTLIKAAAIGIKNDSLSLFTNANAVAFLDNVGQVALKMVEHIASAEDEKVEMNLISEFVQAYSKAAILIENPQIPQLEDMRAEIVSLKEQIGDDKKKLVNQIEQSTARHLELANKTKLGFTATSTSNQALSSGTIVKFDKVQVNEGNHYDSALGIFICPLTGVYSMSVSISAYSTNHIKVYLIVDGTYQFNLYSDGGHSGHDYNSVSQTGLVKCNAGSKIWAQAYGSGHAYGGQHTSFSGFLYKTL